MMIGFGMGVGLLLMLLFWGALIAGAILLVKAIFPGTDRPAGRPTQDQRLSAREILDRRYARGEITREQYEGMRQELQA